jgi:hypothetical protein
MSKLEYILKENGEAVYSNSQLLKVTHKFLSLLKNYFLFLKLNNIETPVVNNNLSISVMSDDFLLSTITFSTVTYKFTETNDVILSEFMFDVDAKDDTVFVLLKNSCKTLISDISKLNTNYHEKDRNSEICKDGKIINESNCLSNENKIKNCDTDNLLNETQHKQNNIKINKEKITLKTQNKISSGSSDQKIGEKNKMRSNVCYIKKDKKSKELKNKESDTNNSECIKTKEEIELDEMEERTKRKFKSKIFTYTSICKAIEEGKLKEEKISPLFINSYKILKFMDKNDLLDCESSIELFLDMEDYLEHDLASDFEYLNDFNKINSCLEFIKKEKNEYVNTDDRISRHPFLGKPVSFDMMEENMDKYMIPKTIDKELENYEKELEDTCEKDLEKYKQHCKTKTNSYGIEYDIFSHMEKTGLLSRINYYIIYNDLLSAIKDKEPCNFDYISNMKDRFNCLDFVKEKLAEKSIKTY